MNKLIAKSTGLLIHLKENLWVLNSSLTLYAIGAVIRGYSIEDQVVAWIIMSMGWLVWGIKSFIAKSEIFKRKPRNSDR